MTKFTKTSTTKTNAAKNNKYKKKLKRSKCVPIKIINARDRLKKEWNFNKAEMCAFIKCNSLTKKIYSPAFWDGLALLKKWGMNKTELCAFMCSGISEKADSPIFWEGVDRLKTDWGFDKMELFSAATDIAKTIEA
jgi:hypothetical protein